MNVNMKEQDPLDEVSRELARCRRDPVHFVRNWLGIRTLWAKQVEILEAIRDHRKVAVASCHESGKTFISAAAAIWFFHCHWPSVVVTTAPGGRQTESLLWANIRAMKAGARVELPGRVSSTSWKLEDEPRSFMIGFSTSPDRAQEHATRFTGFHSDHLLLVFDEAAGIAKPIWDAAYGLMTSGHVRWLAIGNPSDPAGEFARAWNSGDWHRIRIDAYETPNIAAGEQLFPFFPSLVWLEEMQRKCGPDYEASAEYQFKVRGIFPTTAIDTLIGATEFQAACERESLEAGEEPPTMGVDVARFGDDRTVLLVVQGPEILHAEAYGKQDTVFTANRVIAVAKAHGLYPADAHRISVDDTGVGGGVVDLLRGSGWYVNVENFGEKPKLDEESVVNRRTELWIALRDWIRTEACLAGLSRETREELRADLTSVKYRFHPDGRRILEPKDDLRKRLGRSPDYGDALALALAWRTVPRRLDYSNLFRGGDASVEPCPREDPCGDRDCPRCGGLPQHRRPGFWDGIMPNPPGPSFFPGR